MITAETKEFCCDVLSAALKIWNVDAETRGTAAAVRRRKRNHDEYRG